MSKVDRQTTLAELAALISQALERAGIIGTLSGGGAVSLYSENEYESFDLDFVSSGSSHVIAEAIAPLGFRFETGTREFRSPDTDYYAEFPPGPLAFGESIVSDRDASTIITEFGPIRIVTPTQSVMDRLAAYVAWNDNQALDQAVMVASRQTVEWSALREWCGREGVDVALIDRLMKRAGQR